ncbi:hypothetical protein ACFYPT_35450 [Streptomyces sp. NPDC005529]|uniref:hypothetical protein n=1 Tax=unclassified Streptomyces TaxID=2593676 RepID=UPI0033BDA2FA
MFGEQTPDAAGLPDTQPMGADNLSAGRNDIAFPVQPTSRAARFHGPQGRALPVLPVPRLTPGLERMGEYKGSGFNEPKYLVRRSDGQVIQLSRLLYLVVSAVDGVRNAEGISHFVSGRYEAEVTTDNVVYLLEKKLAPLGVMAAAGAETDQAPKPRSDLLLVLKGHKVVFREEQVARIASALAWLHRPPIVALALLGTALMDVWLFGIHGAMTPVLRVLEQPIWMLIVFFLTVASLVFHEFGHASACRYSGAKPGKIGYGIFLIWPSMYTDVTDVYRVGRGGRLRTGLGGVYFNVLFMLLLTAAYAATGQPYLLAAVYLAHFEVLEQLMPAVRLDGYYILGDLAGVPDLYGKVKPILLSALPNRPVHPDAADLKRSARIVVTVWVATMIPLLLAETCYALWNLPRLASTSLRSLVGQLAGTISAFGDGQIAAGLIGVIGSLMLICPMAGGAYLSVRLIGRLARGALRATEGNNQLRAAIGVAVLATASVLTAAWLHGATPKPLPPAPPVAPVLQPGVPMARPLHTTPHPSQRVTVLPAGTPTPPNTHKSVQSTPSPSSATDDAQPKADTTTASPSSHQPPAPAENRPDPTRTTPTSTSRPESPSTLISTEPTPSESVSAPTTPTTSAPAETDSASETP